MAGQNGRCAPRNRNCTVTSGPITLSLISDRSLSLALALSELLIMNASSSTLLTCLILLASLVVLASHHLPPDIALHVKVCVPPLSHLATALCRYASIFDNEIFRNETDGWAVRQIQGNVTQALVAFCRMAATREVSFCGVCNWAMEAPVVMSFACRLISHSPHSLIQTHGHILHCSLNPNSFAGHARLRAFQEEEARMAVFHHHIS